MSGPYGITQVDVPGALNMLEQARSNRIRQMMLQRQLDQDERTADRETGVRTALARFAGTATPGKAGDTPPASPAAPTGMAGAYATPTAAPTATPPASVPAVAPPSAAGAGDRQRLFSELLTLDPEAASRVMTAFSTMDTAERTRVAAAEGAIARLGLHLIANVPNEADWPAEIQRRASDLMAHGVTQEQITRFTPDRQSVMFRISQARDVEKLAEAVAPHPMVAPQGGSIVDTNTTDPTTGQPRVIYESPTVEVGGVPYARPPSMSARNTPPQPGEVRQTSRGPMRFRGGDYRDQNNYEPVQGGAGQPEAPSTFRGRPVADGGSAVRSVFPQARVTETRRPRASRLGRANPGSWHVRSGGAVDIAPIPGMTFQQYVQRLRSAGYRIIEQRDEVNNPSAHATGPHWHVVLGEGP